MARLSAYITQSWYKGAAWLWLLLPFSILFLLLITARRHAYRIGLFKSWRVSVPVVVVGNISVGGTGKTPLVEVLVRRLRDEGYHPGIASRGYGGDPPVRPYSVTPDTPATISGDEPLLLARRTGVPVVIDSDRFAACRALIERHECDVIVTDDGLQHYRLQRDIEIVVIDSKRGLGNGRVLPMGPLREPVSRLNRVDFLVTNGDADHRQLSGYTVCPMTLRPLALINMKTGVSVDPGQWVSERRVHAIAGIGNPERFFTALEALGFTVMRHPFADHHQFRAGDITFDDALPVIMTEKDAVKCQALQPGDNCWFLTIEAVLEDNFFQALLEQLRQPGKHH